MSIEKSETPSKILIANFTSPLSIGETLASLPEHITLAPPAAGRISIEDVRAEVGCATAEQVSFHTRTSGLELFGNNDTPVRLLEQTEPLQKLHTRIIDILNTLRLLYDATYTGPNYRPHVSAMRKEIGNREIFSVLSKDIDIAIAGLSIVTKRADGSWKVVDNAIFKEDISKR
jgi:hypothetical protein